MEKDKKTKSSIAPILTTQIEESVDNENDDIDAQDADVGKNIQRQSEKFRFVASYDKKVVVAHNKGKQDADNANVSDFFL